MQHITRVVMVAISLQLSLASSLWAFAVGDIVVYSRRGEPFAAEIRLLLEPREQDKEVEATLGSQEAYRGEGFKRPAVIDVLKAVLPPGTHNVVRLFSTVPMQEAAFDLVLSVRAGQVTIVKHYYVVLPPPASAPPHAATALPTIAQVVPVVQSTKATGKASRPPRRTERYGPIEKGETLYSIARALHVPNDRLWQAVVAIWRANKGQFNGGNLHGLQIGTFLEIPPDLTENMAAIRLAEAQDVVASQWEDWQLLQRSGAGKQRSIAALRDAESPAPASGKRDTAGKREAASVPAEKTPEKPNPAQPVVLPVGKNGNMVSMAELQTVLQGLEERLMRRLTPTAQVQDAKTPSAFVSATELQTSIQNLEERLTQRMQQMIVQTPEPVRVGQRPPPQASAGAQPAAMMETVPSPSLLLIPYVLVLTNALLLLLVGVLVWLWLRRRDRVERMQGV